MIKREQFLWDFLKKGIIPNCFESVELNNNIILNKCSSFDAEYYYNLTVISLCPTFLSYNLKDESNYIKRIINNRNLLGAGILIDEKTTLESYLSNHLSSKTRKNVKRFISRLNNSFNIKYEYYYGHITSKTYLYLLSTLNFMLNKRFETKNMSNTFLKNWDNYTKNLFDLINQKQASFFVIYDNDIPISISLNYHMDNSILFTECNAFDTDYYKFGLGHIDNYNLLKWIIENNYQYLDLGNGLSDYKNKWCNSIYNFQYLIYYRDKSLFSKAMASIEIFKIRIKNFLKKIKIDEFILKLKYYFSSSKKDVTSTSISYLFENINISIFNELNNLIEIDLKLNDFLKSPVYDSLYNTNEHINDITIFKLADNIYIIKGKTSILKLIIDKC